MTVSLSYEIILADPPWSYRDSANAGKPAEPEPDRGIPIDPMSVVATP